MRIHPHEDRYLGLYQHYYRFRSVLGADTGPQAIETLASNAKEISGLLFNCSVPKPVSLLLFGFSPELTVPQRLAIGHYDFIQTANGAARFGRIDINGDHVPRPKRVPGPAEKADRRWTAGFASPM